MSDLILNAPSNVRLPGKISLVESDVYKIAERIKEIDPNLSIVLHEGHRKPWVVMERGVDGVERFVSRYEELDQRILDHLRRMLAIPFERRYAKLEREADEANAKLGQMTDEQFERFAYDFRAAAEKSNIITPVWSRSYRPIKKKGMKMS